MKKIISFILILAVIFSSFGVCGYNDVSTTMAAQKKAESYQLKNGKVYKKSGGLVKKKVVTIKKKKYYAKKNGKIAKNKLVTYKGNKYYAGKKGVIKTKSFFKVKKKLYYADKAGKIYKNKLITVKGKLYYSQKDYSIATNKKVTVNGKVYQADKKGVLTEVSDEAKPTPETTASPDVQPTSSVNPSPSENLSPSENPQASVTPAPSIEPTVAPTGAPTVTPTAAPTAKPTATPERDKTDYLTPQDFNAKANDGTADTAAFRQMIKAAYDNADVIDGVKFAKKIYIPSGKYVIDGSIFDESLGIGRASYEISGSGRESTYISFTSNGVLFDNKALFDSMDIRDIGFGGNYDNILMNLKSGSDKSESKLKFTSCSMGRFKNIVNCADTDLGEYEISLTYCKISGCGNTSGKRCQMFVLNSDSPLLFKSFESDIESFYGDCFAFEKDARLIMTGGSIIPNDGNAFNLSMDNKDSSWSQDYPQILCNGSRFEIKIDSSGKYKATLLQTTAKGNNVYATFRKSDLGTTSGASPDTLKLNGAVSILCDDCVGAGSFSVKENNTDASILPSIKFVKYTDLNVNNIVKNASITNKCRFTFDSKFDFILTSKGYLHTKEGLSLCREPIFLGYWNSISLSDGKTIPVPDANKLDKDGKPKVEPIKPYGYVEYVEITIQKNAQYGDKYPVTMTLYDIGVQDKDGKNPQLGKPLQITCEENKVYRIEVNDYVEELQAVITNTNSVSPSVVMNMEIVKY